ncbi:phasin family protein [Acinetobacter brisouii]|uniref:phasin family protein n=1 Tax=Acinetobacter brisouii TaxID=396323 RepID=UPI002ADED042|nr:phasin family protein [Acinetobacter brisouii]
MILNHNSTEKMLMLYGEMFANMNSQYKNMFEPYAKFNSLVAKNFADLTNLQLDAARQYADITLSQVFANSEVKDMQSMIGCCTKQMETMTKLSQQMIEDGKKLASLTAEFKSEFDKLVSESMPNTK